MTHRGQGPQGWGVGVPALPADHVSRPRVTAMLEAGRAPVLVVVAPAGFGKTTAVADWLAETGSPSTWASLEHHDDELVAFFTRVALALEHL